MHHWETALSFTRARFMIALVALFAFGVQTYVVQTHIHAAGAQTMGEAAHKAPQGDKPQDKGNPDDCPICQAFALTGAFVKPLAAVLFLALTVAAATPFLAAGLTANPFFARQGLSRAPPRR
jgi:hypothetical protein